MSIAPKTQTTGARVMLVASAPEQTYSYVAPHSPTTEDLDDWLASNVRQDIVGAVQATANRLRSEGKLGRGGSMNLINNQKCRCVNARAGMYLIEELKRRNVPVANYGIPPGASYWATVSCANYNPIDSGAISSAGVWDAHTVVAFAVYRSGARAAVPALEYDFWASGAPLVYPSGRAMSSVARGKASDNWYSRSETDASGSFDENDCSSFW